MKTRSIFILLIFFFIQDAYSQFILKKERMPIVQNLSFIDSTLEVIINKELKCNCFHDSSGILLSIERYQEDTSKIFFIFTTNSNYINNRNEKPDFAYLYKNHLIIIDCDTSLKNLFTKENLSIPIKYYSKKIDKKWNKKKCNQLIIIDDDSFSIYTYILKDLTLIYSSYKSYCCKTENEDIE